MSNRCWVAQFDAAQIQNRVLHRAGNLLSLAGFGTSHQRRQNADRQMHAGVAVAERSGRHRWRTIPEAGGGGRAAGALGHVLVHLQIFIGMTVAEAFDGGQNQLGVQFLNSLSGEAHAVQCAGTEVLDQHVGGLDHGLQYFLAFLRFGVERQ